MEKKKTKWEEVNEGMADKYAEARIEGKTGKEAKEIAGYAPTTKVQQIERKDGPVHTRIMGALEEKGITEDSLAKEYVEGIGLSKQEGARELDLAAHSQYLKQLGYLMGYGRKDPLVALQVNNNEKKSVPDDDGRIEGLMQEVTGLLKDIKEEIGRRESESIHQGSAGDKIPEALGGVDEFNEEPPKAGGGSGEGPR